MTWNSWAVNRFWVCGDASSPHHESQMSEETVSPQKQEKKKERKLSQLLSVGNKPKYNQIRKVNHGCGLETMGEASTIVISSNFTQGITTTIIRGSGKGATIMV